MSLLNTAVNLLMGPPPGTTGYSISRSLRFNSSDSAYLSRTPASTGDRRKWTFSCWLKRSKLSSAQNIFVGADNPTKNNTTHSAFYFHPNDKLYFGGWNSVYITTDAVYRDPSAWYHIVLVVDTAQATATDRIKLYVNNSLQTYSQGGGFPAQNTDLGINQTYAHYIGGNDPQSGYADHMYADIHFIDGQALDPTSFTEVSATTGQLIPKAYTGTFTGNSFWLQFADNSNNTATTLGKDTSGNFPANNWTPNNLSVTAGAGNDSLVDVPTNGAQTDTGVGGEVRGNYCTLNPLQKGSGVSLANGNLDGSIPAGSAYIVVSTIGMTSGKWYAEYTATGGSYHVVGIAKSNVGLAVAGGLGGDANGWGYDAFAGKKVTGGVQSTYGASYTTNDVIGVAFDADNGTLTFYKNNVSQGTAFTGLTSGPYFFASGTDNSQFTWNFGARSFAYTAPSGFKALCTANLPAPGVTKPNTVMDVKLYTGNGSTQTISGLGFSPDFVWIKSRSFAESHRLLDTIRTATKTLYSDLTIAEGTDSTGLTAFNSDGFTLGSSTAYNQSSSTYVAWTWDAGTSTVTNTQGSITSSVSVRANATAGFSVVTYTGTATNCTVGHGLGVAPDILIAKRRDSSGAWYVYHRTLGALTRLQLNETSAATVGTSFWNSTNPTSTVFSIGSDSQINANGGTFVVYAFAPVVGYSAMSSFVGNGSSEGPFCWCGFRPRFILLKNASYAGADWYIHDTATNAYNVVGNVLRPNTSGAENTYTLMDVLSNGFKMRNTFDSHNRNGDTIIWAAFAESPFQYARAR